MTQGKITKLLLELTVGLSSLSSTIYQSNYLLRALLFSMFSLSLPAAKMILPGTHQGSVLAPDDAEPEAWATLGDLYGHLLPWNYGTSGWINRQCRWEDTWEHHRGKKSVTQHSKKTRATKGMVWQQLIKFFLFALHLHKIELEGHPESLLRSVKQRDLGSGNKCCQ